MRCVLLFLLAGCNFVFPDQPLTPPNGTSPDQRQGQRQPVVPPAGYTVTDLSRVVDPRQGFVPMLRNACGQLVGEVNDIGTSPRLPVLLTPSAKGYDVSYFLLDPLTQNHATAMNSSGQAVGYTDPPHSAFLYDHVHQQFIAMSQLAIHPKYTYAGGAEVPAYQGLVTPKDCPGAESAAYAINDRGQVAGVASTCLCRTDRFTCMVGPSVAMRWDMDFGEDGVLSLRGAPLGGPAQPSAALVLASDGTAGGWVDDGQGKHLPTVFTKDGKAMTLPLGPYVSAEVTLLATLGSGGATLAMGTATDITKATGVVRWEGGDPLILQDATTIAASNAEATLLVGNAFAAALFYFNGKDYEYQDLGTLAKTMLADALTLDENGRILANTNNGPVLLTPIPAPPLPACQ